MSVKLGVLILDTRFPRLPGDPGNPATYKVPAVLRCVEKATVDKILSRSITDDIAGLFFKAVSDLERENVTAITTSCGFLIYLQDRLSSSVNIPVFTSTLLLLPLAWRITQKPVGILTSNSNALTREHFRKAGAEDIDVRIKGLEEKPEFRRVILEDSPSMVVERMRKEIVEAAKELVDESPDIGSVLSECTNLTPFREDIKKTVGKPLFDYHTLVTIATSTTY